jgi:hypothetical protein
MLDSRVKSLSTTAFCKAAFDAIVFWLSGEEPRFKARNLAWGKDTSLLPLRLLEIAMTKKDLLQLLVMRARTNGFDLRGWYKSKIESDWHGLEAALETLASGHRYYALLFSHEFARAFWKHGTQIQFVVPTQHFTRLNAKGQRVTVTRKAYTRRTLKPNAWKYHLREMATSQEALHYIRRFLVTHEELHAQRSGPKSVSKETECGERGPELGSERGFGTE